MTADSNASYEDKFFEWLSTHITPAQLSAIYSVFADINNFCLTKKILLRPLFETDDLSTLSNVRTTVESNNVFTFHCRKQKKTMIAAIRYYCRFIREMKSNISLIEPNRLPYDKQESADQKESLRMSLLDFLITNNISFIDNRQKNGRFWIIGGEELKEFVDRCSACGVTFHYKADGPRATNYLSAWWTTDEVNHPVQGMLSESIETETKHEEPIMTPRLKFFEWLDKRGISSEEILMILASLKQCSDFLQNYRILGDDIYHITSTNTMEAICAFMFTDENFLDTDKRNGNKLLKALQLYSEFFDEQLKEQTDSKPAALENIYGLPEDIPVEIRSEIDELLDDEIFSLLKISLAKENIRTIEELKSLKLWPFMNQNNLYSIAERQTVFTEVRKLLEPPVDENTALLYRLYCGATVYTGETLAKAFLHFCEDIAQKNPLFFRTLLDKKIGSIYSIKIRRFIENESSKFLKMENPSCFISADLSKNEVLSVSDWIIQRCCSERMPISIEEPETTLARSVYPEVQPEDGLTIETDIQDLISLESTSTEIADENANAAWQHIQEEPSITDTDSMQTDAAQECDNTSPEQIATVEKFVLDADMNGVTYDSLSNTLGLTMVATRALVQQCKHIVEIKGRFYHEDAFIDWDEGARQMCLIMEKLMQKNNGYVSSAQLYEYARAEMNMFLNDNDVNDERSVYEIAQHLFEKNSFEGNHYSFISKAHISKTENTIGSNFDVIRRFAEDQGGVFREDDLVEYLTGIGIKAGNLRSQMRLNREPEFFFYEPGTIISAESMKIDDSWKESVMRALKNLLNDADDHIVLRQIQPVWYDSLPALPGHRRWTPLLLQYVLRFYGKEFGAKTIMAMESQSMDTLHAMLVKADSPIQNFGDAVIAYLIESETEQRSFEAEELRQLLVKTGMIQGNALIGNMPKALAKDDRFAWDAKGENVTVRV